MKAKTRKNKTQKQNKKNQKTKLNTTQNKKNKRRKVESESERTKKFQIKAKNAQICAFFQFFSVKIFKILSIFLLSDLLIDFFIMLMVFSSSFFSYKSKNFCVGTSKNSLPSLEERCFVINPFFISDLIL